MPYTKRSFSELSDMKAALETLYQASEQLSGALADAADDETVRTRVQTFCWPVQRLDPGI